ncbi:MAG: hypothetical protein E7495_08235 [Ruminococcus flavefaciens]|jgi:hypothetical protein|nr:hypothetical protein [Ruminococcus flavefaciens]
MDSAGNYVREEKLLDFTFRKDAYVPYTMFRCSIAADHQSFSDTAEIQLVINRHAVHHGLLDSITAETSGEGTILKITSKGFTSLLCQNQIEPGLKSGVSINSLMDGFYTLPYVTHENNSDTSNYIYVKKNSSMWDGVANLSYKLCGTYPYIRGTNCVRITPYPNPQVTSYTADQLISVGMTESGQNLVSNFHMADINGDFGTYDLQDDDVAARKIIRHKYFDLDMQFLQSPQDALVYRDKFCSRASVGKFCTYSGNNGEDLSDVVSFPGVTSKRISAVSIYGSQSGIFTRLDVYEDGFPHQ